MVPSLPSLPALQALQALPGFPGASAPEQQITSGAITRNGSMDLGHTLALHVLVCTPLGLASADAWRSSAAAVSRYWPTGATGPAGPAGPAGVGTRVLARFVQ